MKILVTGGCGFIGSHFITHLLANKPNYEIINLDSLTYAAHPKTPERLAASGSNRYHFLKENIVSLDLVNQLKDLHLDAIVHFAAESHVDRSILDPSIFVQTNVVGTQNLLNIARELGNVRFIHVSTDEVYGSLASDAPAAVEQTPLDPNSPYAASKASSDLMALAAHRTHGQEICITRASNNFGPYQFPEKLIPLVIANALEDKPIPIYGNGMQIRDWLFVEDHCAGIAAVLERGKAGSIYNLSANEGRTNLALVKQLLELLAKPQELIEFVKDRPAHDQRYALNSDKARQELNWQPAVGFDEGLFKTVNWYVENLDWWQAVRDKNYYQYYQANYESKLQPGAPT